MALTRAERPDMHGWESDSLEERAADLRAMLVRTLYVAGTLAKAQPPAPWGELRIPDFDQASYRHEWGKSVAALLLKPFFILAELPTSRSPGASFSTVAGGEPLPLSGGGGDVGGLPAVWVLYIAGSAAWTAVSCYVAHEAKEVIDRYLSRDADLKKMMQTTAAAVRGVELHNEREKLAGHELPLNAAETELLANLGEATLAIANKKDPAPSGNGLEFGALGFIGGAVALWLLLRKEKRQ